VEHAHLLSLTPGTAIAGTLFLTGLIGGFGHCAAMCGPFVLAQVGGPAEGLGLRRLSGWLLLPFQLGRTSTYAALGAASGVLGGGLSQAVDFRWTVAALLAGAAVLLLAQGLHLLAPASRFGTTVARLALPVSQRSGFAFGMTIGLLPCGFLYAALAAAAATGSAVDGAVAMAAFAAGTSASLVGIAAAGRAAATRWRGIAARLSAPFFVANAAMMLAMAARAAFLV
jgi:sulfite exporter TauE/SafE